MMMIEIGKRRRNQPAPLRAVFEALTDPARGAGRRWLTLLDDEQAPRALASSKPSLVVWSSLCVARPGAVIRFDLPHDSGRNGTDLTWTLLVEEPEPDPALRGHFCKRLNVLINADLRFAFGQ